MSEEKEGPKTLFKVPEDQLANTGINVGGAQLNYEDHATHGKVVKVPAEQTPGYVAALYPLGFITVPDATVEQAQAAQATGSAVEATTPSGKARKPV